MKPSIQQRQNYLNDYDEDQELSCSYCEKSFRHRAPLIQHQRTHTKVNILSIKDFLVEIIST